MRSSYLFTSESVSEGHPDKVADQISDSIVDLFLSKDPEARVACETMTTTNRVVLAGEIRGHGIMDQDGNWAPGIREEIEQAVRGVVQRIGYEQQGFHWDRFDFANHLHPQSAHIAQGVDAGENHPVGGRHRLASDARFRILGQEKIDDRVGNLVGDLVGMAFRNGFGGEEEIAAAHGVKAGLGIRDIKKSLYGASSGASGQAQCRPGSG